MIRVEVICVEVICVGVICVGEFRVRDGPRVAEDDSQIGAWREGQRIEHGSIERGFELDHELRGSGARGLDIACQRERSGSQVHGEQRCTGLSRGIDRSRDVLRVRVLECGRVGHRDHRLRDPVDTELVVPWAPSRLHQLRPAVVEHEREHPAIPWHPSILDRAEPNDDPATRRGSTAAVVLASPGAATLEGTWHIFSGLKPSTSNIRQGSSSTP
ncbi:hypothetical protein JM654_01800 [Microbacterium oxydans]|nr:hypothetical protein [Microbacterium oxydans]